ncbi:MAG: MFS transporter [Methanocorpusculum parvum]|nr:MFS transporter [Methanocorpusculum parvum]
MKPFTPSRFTLLVLLAAAMPSLLGTAAVSPVLDLMKSAGLGPEYVVNLVLTLPPLATAVSGFFIGALSDKIGRVRILAVSLFLFALAGVSGFFLDNIYAIIAMRLILGVSIAGLLPMASALISEYYEGEQKTRYLGYIGVSNGIGVLILQTLCGALAAFGWRYAFLVYLLGLCALPFVIICLREPPHSCAEKAECPASVPKPVRYAGIYALVFLPALFMYLVAVNLSYYTGTFAVSVSPFWIGLLLGIFGLSSAVSGFLFWRFSRRFTPISIGGIIFLLEAAGLFLIGISENLILLTAGLILLGFGMGLAMPNGTDWVAKITPPAVLGRYMGGVTVSTFLALFSNSFVSPAVLSIIGEGEYALMFLLFAGLSLLIGAILFAVGKKQAARF